MSLLDGVLGKLAQEHGIDEEKVNQIKEMAEKVDLSEIVKKVGVPEDAVKKMLDHFKKA